MTILELTESSKMMNRHDLTQPVPTVTLFDGLFLGKYKSGKRDILTQSSIKSSICSIKIKKRYL